MVRLLIVATLVAVAASRVLAGMDDVLTEKQHRQHRRHRRHRRHAEERSSHHQALLQDTDAEMDFLETIARRSAEDIRVLTKHMQQQRLDDERHRQEEVQRLEVEKPLLRQRWLRAKRSLKDKKRKAKAAAQVSLQHVEALAAEILTTLQETKNLEDLQHEVNHLTQKVLARRQYSWWQGFGARWRARFAWLVRSYNNVPWFAARQLRDETQPAQDAPEDTDPKQSPLEDAVTADDETDEEVMMANGVVSGGGEADKDVVIVDDPETVGGYADESPWVANSFVTSEAEANDKALTPSHTTPGGVPPSQAKNSGAALQFQYRPLPRWLPYPFVVLSYVFLAVRIYSHFCR